MDTSAVLTVITGIGRVLGYHGTRVLSLALASLLYSW